MIKSIFKIVLFLSVLPLTGTSLFAEDFSWSIGVKGWHSNLELSISNANVRIDDEDTQLLVGPSLSLSYKNAFISATWLKTTSDYNVDVLSNISGINYKIDLERDDRDLIIGYMLHPRVGPFLGFKYWRSVGDEIDNGQTDLDIKIWGFAAGLTANYPLKSLPLVFTVNGNYLFEGNYRFVTKDRDMDGYAIEGAIVYNPWVDMALSLGYKYQSLESEDDDEWKFTGFTLGIDYRF